MKVKILKQVPLNGHWCYTGNIVDYDPETNLLADGTFEVMPEGHFQTYHEPVTQPGDSYVKTMADGKKVIVKHDDSMKIDAEAVKNDQSKRPDLQTPKPSASVQPGTKP